MIRDRARQVYRAGGFVATTVTLNVALRANLARTAEGDKDTVRELWTRRWASALLALFGVQIEVRGTVPPPTKRGGRGRLIVSNHRSAIDIGVLLATVGGTMVSRHDLADWPVVGPAARLVGTIFVDRDDARSGMQTMRTIQTELAAGRTINIFPEGTTFTGDEIRPFHGGAFISATRAGADVLPVGIAYPSDSDAAFFNETFMNHLGRMAKTSKRTRMALVVGTPIATKGRRAADVSKEAHAAVSDLVMKARSVAGP